MGIKPLQSFAAAVILAAMALLAGCASNTDPAAPPTTGNTDGSAGRSEILAQMVADGLANAKSDFQREVLEAAQETGEISESAWKEANNQNKECMAAQGYNIEMVYEGTKVLTTGEVDEHESAAEAEHRKQTSIACYEKTSAFINEIYSYLNGDGGSDDGGFDGETAQRAVLACLIERKLVPADTSYDQFVADLEQNGGKQFAPNGQTNEAEIAQCWIENT